jgi:hypothetical protein
MATAALETSILVQAVAFDSDNELEGGRFHTHQIEPNGGYQPVD